MKNNTSRVIAVEEAEEHILSSRVLTSLPQLPQKHKHWNLRNKTKMFHIFFVAYMKIIL